MSDIQTEEIDDPADLEAAFAIRREVFCREQGVSEDEEYDGRDGRCRHFLVRLGGDPIGTARTQVLPGGETKIERVAVLKPHRGGGAGRALMRHIIRNIEAGGGTRMVLNAQIASRGFYAGLGFTAEGDIFEEAGIPHVHMIR